MPETLQRLKPNPIPTVHPVPEYAASERLRGVYERTKQGLGVPWMGVVTMAFSHYPRFYDCLWSALAPVVTTETFAQACQRLRATAEDEATELGPQRIVPQLEAMGYGTQELEDIRACNEVFSSGNMPYLLIATRARLLLEGHEWDGQGEPGANRTPEPVAAKPVLLEPHHADPTMAALYADIRETLGLPFVNTDYRAFARWPSYFELAWGDMKAAISSASYAPVVERVHATAVELATSLPNPTGLTSARLVDAAREDASLEEVRDVVRLFQWLLPGLAVNVAFMREQLLDQA